MTMASGVGRVVRRGESETDGIVAYDLLFESIRQFQSDFAPMISTEGLFIETDEPLETSTVLRFRVVLPDDFVLIEGTGVVVWIRTAEDTGPPPLGMAIRFATLNERSRELIEKVVDAHVRDGGRAFNVDSSGSFGPGPEAVVPPSPPAPPAKDKASAAEREAIRFSVRGASPPPKADAPPITEPAAKPVPKAAATGAVKGTAKASEAERSVMQPAVEARVASPPPVSQAEQEASLTAPGSGPEAEGQGVEFTADVDEVTASELDFGAATATEEERAAGHDFYAQLAAREEEDRDDVGVDAEELSLDAEVPLAEAAEAWVPPESDQREPGDAEFAAPAVEPVVEHGEAVEALPLHAVQASGNVWQEPSAQDAESQHLLFEEPGRDLKTGVADHAPEADADAFHQRPPAQDLEREGRQIAASFEPSGQSTGPEGDDDWGTVMAAAENAQKASPVPPSWSPGLAREEEAPGASAEAAGGGEFAVSLFDPDEGMDTTPRMAGFPDAGEITVEGVEKRRSPFGRIAVIGAVVAVVAAGAYFGPGIFQQLFGGDGEQTDLTQIVTPAGSELAPVETSGEQAADESTAGGEGAADAIAETPEPTPVPTAVPERQVAPGPAREVLDIGFEVGASGTTITIVGDAAIHEELVSTFPMGDPPRVLVRIRKIAVGYPRETVAVESNEVAQIRVGHHPEQSPPALYVVLDLMDDQVSVLGTEIRGDVLRVSVGR